MANDKLEIIPALPNWFHRPSEDDDRDLIGRLTGAKIVRIGAPNADVEGGGLVIDYIPAGATEPLRVVFAFNELAMWVEWDQAAPEEDNDTDRG